MNFTPLDIAVYVCGGVGVCLGVLGGAEPFGRWILKQERIYGHILRTSLLLDVQPRSATYFAFGCVVVCAALAYLFVHSLLAPVMGAVIGAAAPMAALRLLRRRRLSKLDDQLVDGVQTLASGVRAGLNLVQAFELVAGNLPAPICQEFAHLLREYEYGVPIESAMDNAAERIGRPNYRLVFSALQTHRQRGGDLGETLDRIAESVREIQRLEKRVETLTAQGRAAARWMGAMPAVILLVLYSIEPEWVRMLFVDDLGKALLAVVVAMNVAGFLWIRQIVSIDI
ncbi:MAG: type II secretion system F family protein [Planctomycetes bacterium]|nr:type II secretion system F family protein [Planctomycetota bacterium]